MIDYIPFPNKKYQVLYADPPWEYEDKALSGNRGAGCKYPVQGIEWIYNLPVQNITDENCILFLWVTMPLLQEGLNTIKRWGFEYKTNGFVWVKTNKKSRTWFWGMGNWTRSNPELCLIGLKGDIKRMSAKVHSVINSPIDVHSKKPPIVKDKIDELVGDIPKIELFGRQSYPGWDVWGNQVKKFKIQDLLIKGPT